MKERFAFLILLIVVVAGCSGSESSNTTTQSTAVDYSAPTDPNLNATAVSTSRIDLVWMGSTDNVAVTEYEVWRGTSKIAIVSAQSYSDIGLLAGTLYKYTVKAVDAAGNRSPGMNSAAVASSGTGSSVKLPQTGQTTCFDSSGGVIDCLNTGQNGELQKGVAWPTPRFTVNADTSLTDTLTGLIWAPNGNVMKSIDSSWDTDNVLADGKVTWQHALDYVSKLNAENYLGHNDWRLPNRKEIRSLVNYGQANSSAWLNTQGFANAELNFYWSSTSAADFGNNAWMISLGDGSVFEYYKTYDNCVLPVRAGDDSNAPAVLPKTGQTTCYDNSGLTINCANTGQDGDYQKGSAWPDPRFADNGNSTITDNLTGLTWSKDANAPGPSECSPGSAMDWQGALDYVACLNTHMYLGYTDWRLPDVNELESLSNEGQSGGSGVLVWLNLQGFIDVQGRYWSSTSSAYDAFYARYVHMANAMNYDESKADMNFVWPVRSGQ